jgi:hypothetical protein
MGLKDKTSLYDLVQGPNAPVGNMENTQGASNFDLGNTSTLQPDSLLNQYSYTQGGQPGLAGGINGSNLDLNGQQGALFNLGAESTLQPDSLLSVYNNSPLNYTAPQSGTPLSQDLDGGLPSTGKYENNGPDGGFY